MIKNIYIFLLIFVYISSFLSNRAADAFFLTAKHWAGQSHSKAHIMSCLQTNLLLGCEHYFFCALHGTGPQSRPIGETAPPCVRQRSSGIFSLYFHHFLIAF